MTRRLFGCAAALALALGGDASARPAGAPASVEARLGPGWRAVWSADGRVPRRVYGEGLAVPGANASAVIAEAAARRLLAEHLALLAPGSAAGDWELVANLVHGRGGDLRSVGFVQRHAGMRVIGGQVGFLFKRDRMIVMSSAAVPDVRIAAPARLAPDAELAGNAVAWIERAHGGGAAAGAVGGEVQVLATARGPRTVRTVVVERAVPRGRWDVRVDAATAEVIDAASTLRFETGTLRYEVPVRHPGTGRMAYLADTADILIDGAPNRTDHLGVVQFFNPTAVIRAFATGQFVAVTEFGTAGGDAIDLTFTDGATRTWQPSADPLVEAQVSAFVHASIVKRFAVTELDPLLPWLTTGQLGVVVNEPGTCNAYSDGNSIHFLVSGGGCQNSALIADIVYHEFSHALHTHAFIPGVGATEPHMSEGVADYLAATITGDPGFGRGFRLAMGDAPERDLDPADGEAVFPDDFDVDDPHISGLIIGGALWDLRKELIAAHGADEGKRRADDLYYAILRRANEMEAAYVEVLAADDDNGNLDDGTPNKCAIDRAFAPHGLSDPTITVGIAVPDRTDFTVRISTAAPPGDCPDAAVASAVLTWRNGSGAAQDVEMTAGTGELTGLIPEQPDGSDVFYTVTVTTVGGGRYGFPQNPADPEYHFHVAPLVPVYCTDFESDPFAAGWTQSAGPGTSEWAWGAPVSLPRVGDPGDAFSGNNVVGMDLGAAGGNGRYAPSTIQVLTSPAIELGGRQGARLRYRRWLGVEDGFYDDAHVTADGEAVWRNAVGGAANEHLDHQDREWRFQDLDLAAQAADDAVQISFRLESDGNLQFGGWNLDDFCVVARPLPGELCGDGALGGMESCDDGNLIPGDGCDEVCEVEVVIDEGCCSTGRGSPAGPIGLGVLTTALLLWRRRYTVRTSSTGTFPRK